MVQLVPMSGKSIAHPRGALKSMARRGFAAVYIYQGRPEIQAAPAMRHYTCQAGKCLA